MVIVTQNNDILYRLSNNNSAVDHINFNEAIDILIVVYSFCETYIYKLSNGQILINIAPSLVEGYCYTQFMLKQKWILILQPVQIVFVSILGKFLFNVNQERTGGQLFDLAYVVEDINALYVSIFGCFYMLDSRTMQYLTGGIVKFIASTSISLKVDLSRQWSINCSPIKKMCFIFENRNMVQVYQYIDMKRNFYSQYEYLSDLKIIFAFSTDSYLIMNQFDISQYYEYDLKRNNIQIMKVYFKQFIIDIDKDSLVIAINNDVLIFKLSTLTFIHHIHSSTQMVRNISLNLLTNQLLVITKAQIVYYDYDYSQLFTQYDHNYLSDITHKNIVLSPIDTEQFMVINYSQSFLVEVINLKNREIVYSNYIHNTQQAMYILKLIKISEHEFIVQQGCNRYILVQYKQNQFVTVSDVIVDISTCKDSSLITELQIFCFLQKQKLYLIDSQTKTEKLQIDIDAQSQSIVQTFIFKNNLFINIDNQQVVIIEIAQFKLTKIESLEKSGLLYFYQNLAIFVNYQSKVIKKYDLNEQNWIKFNYKSNNYNSQFIPKKIYISNFYFLIESDDSLIYAYNIQTLQVLPNKLHKPSTKYSKIKILDQQNLILIFSYNQINIYETIGLGLITKVRKINVINIRDVFFIEQGLLLIVCEFNIFLQSYSTTKSTTIQQFSFTYPSISYIQKKEIVSQTNQFILYLKGSYESEILQIEHTINRLSLYQQVPEQLSCLKSIEDYQTGINLIETTKLIKDYINSYQKSTIVKVLEVGIQLEQNLILSEQIFQIISPQTQINVVGKQSTSKIYLGDQSQISSQIQFLSVLNLKILKGLENQQSQFDFNISKKLQQLNIVNNKIESDCPIIFKDIQVVNIQDLIINIKADLEKQIFLNFQNITSVNILNLNIEIHNQNQNIISSLIKIIDSNKVNIDTITIKGVNIDYSVNSFILIENVNNLTIKNVKILENSISRCMIEVNNVQFINLQDFTVLNNNLKKENMNIEILQKQYFIFVQGGQYLEIRNIKYLDNKYIQLFSIQELNIDNRTLKVKKTNISLLFVQNTHLTDNQLIHCQSQNINITQSEFFKNQSILELIRLYGEQISLNKITLQENESNLFILKVQSYSTNLDISEASFSECEINLNVAVENNIIAFIGLNYLQSISNKIQKNQVIKSKIGGTFYIQNVKTSLIEQNYICDNVVFQGSGGGILIYQSAVTLKGNFIERNKAEIGGGIRYTGDETSIKFVNSSNTISGNQAILYGNNICSYPQNIILEYQDQIILGDKQFQVRSGIKFDSFLKVKVTDEEGHALKLNTQPNSTEIIQEYLQYQLDIQSTDSMQVEGNLQTLDDYYEYQPTLTFQPLKSSFLTFSLSSTILKYDNQTNSFKSTKINFTIPIEFVQCQQGDVPRKLGNGHIICYQCPEGSYSLQEYGENSNELLNQQFECLKCPDGVLKCYQNQIQLANGYWRPSNQSDNIVPCYNKEENCIQQNLDDSFELTYYDRVNCIEGTIGARCESCDSTGKVWGRAYGRASLYNCTACDNYFLKMILLFGVIIFNIFYNYFAISSITNQYKQKIIYGYLKKMEFIFLSKTQLPKLSTMVIKIAINYFQILNILSDYRLNLSSIQISITIIGDQSSLSLFSLDCELAQQVILYQLFP